ncbi:hypothetical protein [Pararhodonellum marinum]|uniref:hypothetical protein n=1 Tax=Pararhodonellum marinum TaxID=2755358 RepID=UPI00188FB509|nr:hypothetical protein [Pararhodonellum marinum]
MDHEILAASLPLIEKNLDLKPIPEQGDKAALIKYLIPVVGELLDQHFEKLLQICYRVDLDEITLKAILHESEPDKVKLDLTTALVDRHLLKAAFRKKYGK